MKLTARASIQGAVAEVSRAELILSMEALGQASELRFIAPDNLCKAGELLKTFKAKDLGLREKDWLLPRQLVAYTRNIQCKKSASDDEVQLPKLLTNIQRCAQMIYGKP
ncbi:hypothetical protein MHYP_G00175150 [Metynnis hypsauchen]